MGVKLTQNVKKKLNLCTVVAENVLLNWIFFFKDF